MSHRVLVFSLIVLALLRADQALAQVEWSSALPEADCVGPTVKITVDLDVFGEVPPEIVGWVVDRRVLGACVPEVQVGDVLPLPVGQQQFVLFDQPTVMDRMTLYFVSAVDGLEQRTPIRWLGWWRFAQADCVGGPAARGTVVEIWPGRYHLEACATGCWWQLSFYDNQYPPDIPDLVGEVIDLYGEIHYGFEGPFVYVSSWDYAPDGCDGVVPVDDMSWSAIKSLYR